VSISRKVQIRAINYLTPPLVKQMITVAGGCAVPTLGIPFYPPFRFVEKDVAMLESYPSFFVVVAHFMQPASILEDTIPEDKQIQIVAGVNQGVITFLGQEEVLKDFLPRSIEKAKRLQITLALFFRKFSRVPGPHPTIDVLKTTVDGL
jgi:hypothetical protein